MSQSRRDANQVLKGAWREVEQALATTFSTDPSNPIPVAVQNALITKPYDEIDLSYFASGANVGQLQTVTYKLSGVTQNTLTLAYDGSNNLTSVVRT